MHHKSFAFTFKETKLCHSSFNPVAFYLKFKTIHLNYHGNKLKYYRLTSLSSDALAAFVDLGIMCPYVIPHISLSEESFATQLQKRELNIKNI